MIRSPRRYLNRIKNIDQLKLMNGTGRVKTLTVASYGVYSSSSTSRRLRLTVLGIYSGALPVGSVWPFILSNTRFVHLDTE